MNDSIGKSNDTPTALSRSRLPKDHVENPVEDFAFSNGIPLKLAICLIGKTEDDTMDNVGLFKTYLHDIRANKIPGKRPDDKFTSALGDNEIVEIVKAYFTHDCNATRAEEYLPYTRKTITKYWKQLGLNLAMGAPTKVAVSDKEPPIEAGEANKEELESVRKDNRRLIKELEATKKLSVTKRDTFQDRFDEAEAWIAGCISGCVDEIQGAAVEIEKIKGHIYQKKRKIEKLETSISEYNYFIVDALEQGLWYLNNAKDICTNKEKADFIEGFGCVYKLNKKAEEDK